MATPCRQDIRGRWRPGGRFTGLAWIDHGLAAIWPWRWHWARRWLGEQDGRGGWRDPVFGSSFRNYGAHRVLTMKDHPQPRYFVVPAFLVFIVMAMGAAALVEQAGWGRKFGWAVVAAVRDSCGRSRDGDDAVCDAPGIYVGERVTGLTHYIDAHPNGERDQWYKPAGARSPAGDAPADDLRQIDTEDLAEKLGRFEAGVVFIMELTLTQSLARISAMRGTRSWASGKFSGIRRS